ncbi:CBO0543 family protein [Peribacillus glennii]|uniref:CBO0543 family protein n=1 Tax=Peribacillus glennii TaxID=2303991 RepID=UPI00389B3224
MHARKNNKNRNVHISLICNFIRYTLDLYMDTKYHFYWYFDKDIDWRWLIVLLGGKPSFTLIYLNFFPFYSKTQKKVLYILVWSIVVTIMEIGAVYIGKVLHYDEWKLLYSAALYPLLLYILYLNGLFVKKLLKAATAETDKLS